ncbi:MAG: acyl-CoA dehydrogenase family protein [Chloroflexota bacterium]|nr:acyl-CoA dehydrogenase family protein [Chloroflexota bacterium]
MGLRELSVDMTEEQKATRDMVKRFATEIVRPAGIELDRMHDPQDVIAKGSPLWEVFRKYRELGLHRGGLPPEVGGIEQDALTSAIISENVGWGDGGLAVSLSVSVFPYIFAMMSPDPQVQDWTRQYCEDTEGKIIGCWAITEPDHGSDWIWFEGENSSDPKCAPSVRAVQDGDDFIINGQKSAWVSDGNIATHAALFLSLDPTKGMGGCGLAAVPLDLPGITRGKPLDKMGQRTLNQGEIFFDNVRIPKSMLVIQDPAVHNMVLGAVLSGANGAMGNMWVGVAQSALDEALRYSKERVQGGRPICEHQNIKLKLFDMFVSVEAARRLSRAVTAFNRATQPPALQYATGSKVFATNTAFRVASEAIAIFGGYGVTKEYVIEKIFRDARAAMIEDGANETLALAGADRILAGIP